MPSFTYLSSSRSFSDYIDRSTPQDVYSFIGTNDVTYDLAFSDEFNFTGQTYRHRGSFLLHALLPRFLMKYR